MQARKMVGMAVAAMLLSGGVAMGQTHAPWPTNWNNWNDPALWVTVGNAGNAPDTPSHSGNSAGQGAVAYEYNIGKYEVTAGQYTAFLNAVAKTDTYGLYNARMDSSSYGCQITRHGTSGNYTYDFSGRPSGTEADWVNRPVNYVSYWDSCRFANWLGNGHPMGVQGPGTTEDGAYTLTTSGIANNTITRNAGATWVVPSGDEWYKAAYHDKTAGLAATYFNYPTSSNTMPGRDMADVSGNNANYPSGDGIGDLLIGSPYYRTPVGEFQNSDSPYGTFDQGCNVWERNEEIMILQTSLRGLRGGSFMHYGFDYMHASSYSGGDPASEDYNVGFRVAEVPEPATLSLLALGGLALIRRRRR